MNKDPASRWPTDEGARLEAGKTLLNSKRGNSLMVMTLTMGIEDLGKMRRPPLDDIEDMQLLLDLFQSELKKARAASQKI